MSRNKRLIAPALIIVLPILVLLFLKLGKNHYKELPYFGNPSLNAKGDTVKHTVPPFSFINQEGNAFGSKELDGKIYLAEFFFTRCPSICPVMCKNLKKILDAFPNAKEFNIVSITVDPEHDNAEALKKYATKNKITDSRWHFLTGNKDSIYELMNTKGFLILKPEPNESPAMFKHSGTISLIDKTGHIRAQYDGTSDEEMDKMIEDIHVLRLSYAKR